MSYNEELADAELAGKVLIAISLDAAREKLILHTNAGDYLFETYGDCCSHSWVEHFDQVKESSVILGFKEIEVPPSYCQEAKPTATEFYEEEVSYYFYEILTDKGSLMIEMRNSSNGYYGGDLCFQGLII